MNRGGLKTLSFFDVIILSHVFVYVCQNDTFQWRQDEIKFFLDSKTSGQSQILL